MTLNQLITQLETLIREGKLTGEEIACAEDGMDPSDLCDITAVIVYTAYNGEQYVELSACGTKSYNTYINPDKSLVYRLIEPRTIELT